MITKTTEAYLRQLHAKLKEIYLKAIERPILAYIPHDKQYKAHKDKRPYIFFGGANRGGKSFFLAQEVTWHIEGSHPFKTLPDPPYSIYIVSTNLDKLWNEPGQLISLLRSNFPPSHPMGEPRQVGDNVLEWDTVKGKVSIFVKSDRQRVDSFKGGEPILIVIDEEIKYKVFEEIRARRISRSGQVIYGATVTPEEGGITWTHDKILKDKDIERNNHPRWGVYQVSAWDNPYLDHKQLQIEYEEMDESDRAVRIDGELTPRARLPVFNQMALTLIWKRSVEALNEEYITPRFVNINCAPIDTVPTLIDDDDAECVIYREPTIGHKYIIGLDTSRGGLDDDYAVVQVVDQQTFEQVARWRGTTDITTCTDIAVGLARYFNNGLLAVELANEGFKAVYRIETQHKYINLFRGRPINARKRGDGVNTAGWITNSATKSQMIQSLIDAIKPYRKDVAGPLYVYDHITMKELRFYERKATGKIGAMHGLNDDCVTCLAMVVHIAGQESLHLNYIADTQDRTALQEYYDLKHEEGNYEADSDMGACY